MGVTLPGERLRAVWSLCHGLLDHLNRVSLTAWVVNLVQVRRSPGGPLPNTKRSFPGFAEGNAWIGSMGNALRR
jgi:hypothetical protein